MFTVKGPRTTPLLVCATLVVVMVVVLSPVAQADILSPGGAGKPDLLTPGGTQIASVTGMISFLGVTVNYTASVRTDPGNAFCSGCLDFTYVFTNRGSSSDDVARVQAFSNSVPGFGNFMEDVGYNPATPGVIPTGVDRSAGGNIVGFNFTELGVLDRGASSVQLVIETNATNFSTNGGRVSAMGKHGGAAAADAFQPTSGTLIPEPSSLLLLGSGVLIFVQGLRRKLL